MKKFFVGFLVVLGVYLYFQGKSEGMDKLVNGTSYVDSEEAKQMKQIIIEEAKESKSSGMDTSCNCRA